MYPLLVQEGSEECSLAHRKDSSRAATGAISIETAMTASSLMHSSVGDVCTDVFISSLLFQQWICVNERGGKRKRKERGERAGTQTPPNSFNPIAIAMQASQSYQHKRMKQHFVWWCYYVMMMFDAWEQAIHVLPKRKLILSMPVTSRDFCP